MRQRFTTWIFLSGAVLLLAGCEETAKKQVQVHPPASTPAPVPEFVHQPIPISVRPIAFVSLSRDARPGIEILLEKVGATLNAGQDALKAGDAVSARKAFDRAVELILASGFQADSDPRLSELFDRIGEGIENCRQIGATENADEDAEEPGEPAPIDEIADMNLPPGDPRLAVKAEKELIGVPHDLPLTVNDSVLQYLSFFTTARGRAIVERGLSRAGRYNEMIRRVLKEEGVPQDLIYLAQAESAFQPQAVSRAGARGIWQFMPYRGGEYDLERSYWVDERSDPEKATHAAAQHMRDLYAMFGDWYLVLAAYNSGPLNVVKAIERTGYADFWELQKRNALPKETRNYVPIIIALALVAKDPALYGIHVEPEKPAKVDTIRPGHQISLRLVADATGADLDELRELNPDLLRNVTPADPQYELRLPAGLAQKFQENVPHVPQEKWTSWRLHAVEEGETLAEIARRYHVTVPALEDANHLEAHATVPTGFLLTIPMAPETPRLVRYRVQRGDTLEGIASRFNVTVSELKRWNHIAGSHVGRGVRLRIYAGGQPADAPRAKAKPAQNDPSVDRKISGERAGRNEAIQHVVKKGETLYSIAREYGTTVSAIRRSNPRLVGRPLEVGDVLTIQR
jgi:membrane-bound lytic murein transglycosylase D